MSAGIIAPVTNGVKSVWNAAGKHAPTLLIIVAGGSAISSVVSAVKATPKALVLLEQKKKQIAHDEDIPLEEVELTVPEVIKTTWKCYAPSAVLLFLSLGCMAGSAHISAQRELGWAALYSATKKASDAYERQVVNRIGSKENDEIKNEVYKEQLRTDPIGNNNITKTEYGNYLCFDPLSGRYFSNDIEHIRRVVNELNRVMIGSFFGYVSLNEFYQNIGLDPVELGYESGWNTDELIDIEYSTMLASDDQPCLVLKYQTYPHYNYNKMDHNSLH